MTDWDEAEKRFEQAHEFYERGKWEDALRELNAAISINPYNGSWYFNLGLTLDMMDRYDEAISAYVRALEMDPDDIETLNALGSDCTRAGRYDEAIRHFERIEQLDAAFEPCYCNRIIAYTEKGDHDRAEEMFYLARQYKEKCPHCFCNMGNSLMARGQFDRALWCWNQALELDPQHPQVHARIADAYWAKGQLAEARTHLLDELRASPPRPGEVGTLLDLGELLMEMQEFDAAGEKFRQVLEFDPEECTAHFCLGELAMRAGDQETALLNFRRVIRNDKTYPGVHLKVARIYHAQRDSSEAIYHANCELAQQDIDEETLVELGSLFMDLHQHQNAEAAFSRALTRNPQNAEARHNLAVTLLMTGRTDEGIEQCRLALRIQPKFMLALSNLALAYMTKKDYTRARYFLREALDIAPEDPQLRQLQSRLKLQAFLHWLKTFPRRAFGRKRS